jgi:hypothetical protein
MFLEVVDQLNSKLLDKQLLHLHHQHNAHNAHVHLDILYTFLLLLVEEQQLALESVMHNHLAAEQQPELV